MCRGKLAVKDKSIYKSMLSFSSWALIGSLAGSLSNQGINILLNIFFGPAVNAARGLACLLYTSGGGKYTYIEKTFT